MLKKYYISELIFAALTIVITAIFVYGCSDNTVVPPPSSGTPNAVYTQSNQSAGNNVLMYTRAADGNLTFSNSYSTQGTGTGAGLNSQGSLAFNDDRTFLYAVNAGSNDISVFSVGSAGLTYNSKISSGGTMPVSLAVRGDLLYVLNAGGSGNITGFKINSNGSLTLISGSGRNLSNNGVGSSPGPAQVSFNPAKTLLVVTERLTNKIVTYTVNADGTVTGPQIFSSAGITPFGFEFRNDGQLVVSEAYMGGTDSSAVSSYSISTGGALGIISGPVFTTETAACWIAITNNDSYAYTSNTGSGTITGFSINSIGVLTILNAGGVAADLGAGSMPTDIALSSDSQFLYSLNSGSHTISTLSVGSNGSLSVVNLSSVTGLQTGTVGLIAK